MSVDADEVADRIALSVEKTVEVPDDVVEKVARIVKDAAAVLVEEGRYPDGVERMVSDEDEHLLTIGVAVEQGLRSAENVEKRAIEADGEDETEEIMDDILEKDGAAVSEGKEVGEEVIVPPAISVLDAIIDDEGVTLTVEDPRSVDESEVESFEVADTNALLLFVPDTVDERVTPNTDALTLAENDGIEAVAVIVAMTVWLATLLRDSECEEDFDFIGENDALTHEVLVSVIRIEREDK